MLFELWVTIFSILVFSNMLVLCLLIMRRPLSIRYGLAMLPASSLACFSNILLLYSQDYEGKLILYDLCVLLDLVIITSFVLMVMEFTKRFNPEKPRILLPLLIVPAVVAFSVMTDPWLHSFYRSVAMSYSVAIDAPVLAVTPSLFWYVWDTYSWIIVVVFTSLMILYVYRKVSRRMGLTAAVVIGIIFSVVFLSYLAVELKDVYFPNLAYALAAFSLFSFSLRFGIFDLTPAGRQKMLDVIKDIVVVVDARLRVSDVNQSCQDYIGRPAATVIDQRLDQVLPLLPGFDVLSASDRGTQLPSEVTDASGQTFEVIVEEFEYGKRAETGYLIILHDITERKAVEAALREAEAQRRIAESERKYRTVVDNQSEAIISFTPDGTITFVNKVVENYLGMDGDALSRLSVQNFVPLEGRDHLEEQITAMTPGHPVGELELEFLTHDGRPLNMLWRLKGIFERGELQEVQAVGIDVTERHRFEQELARNQRLESLGVLAGGIAHDFNNMLASIVGNMEIAMLDLPEDGRARARLEESTRSAMRARHLTRQLLTFSKGGEPVKESVDLSQFIRSSVEFMLAGSKIEAIYDIEEGLPRISADPIQFEQVLNNLVMNALQAMPDGGHINVTAKSFMADKNLLLPIREGRCVRLEIRDEGMGIPKEILDRIFDPFFTTKENGTGLGLSTIQSIVRNHGGIVLVDSKVGVGTTMSVIVPIEELETLEPVPVSRRAEACPSGRALVMDDEEPILIVMAPMLESLGLETICVKDGEEAIAAYREARSNGEPFSVVIMDLTIRGGMGGKEAVRGILADDPEAKVIVFSGYSNDPIMAHPQDYGFTDVLQKPFTLQDLSVKLSDVLAR